MQLYLSPPEFKLLAGILMNQECPPHLLAQVLERHLQLDYDELDQLREILLARSSKLKQAPTADVAAGEQGIEAERALLNSMLDKVTEACEML